MIDPKALLADLQREVKHLETDLRPTDAEDSKLHVEWQEAHDIGRTAAAFEDWLRERVTQVAVAWVLATVFVRFCEDNGLIGYPFIAGPGERTAQARELQEEYFQAEANRHKTDREWLCAAFDEMSKSPVAKGLFAEHNPMWTIYPSHDAAKALIAFWRKTGADGEIVYDFTDPGWNTRFLGDLYQDLSTDARKMYALLQTPEFVEEFILKYTLDPAIEEFGLEPEPPYGHDDLPKRLRVIDPACGSGHFLLGAFHRLLKAWEDEYPGTDQRVLVANALESIHGVDKNPFAAAIARFRLLLAAMRIAHVNRLDERVDFPLNIAVGDSLLHGYKSAGTQGEFDFGDGTGAFTYRTEDIDGYIKSVHMLAFGTYHAVFANPPYITVRDRAESDRYRELYASCYREYSLSVPFAERIFKLAIRGSLEGAGAGYTGQITANSFMKREFGKKLIEEFFSQIDLTHVIDSSGAYLPGFGTPTVILFGRWRYARRNSTIRAVLAIQGEPRQPADPAHGLVWRAIVEQIDSPGSESQWVSVIDLARERLAHHPWTLGGGGAVQLRESLEAVSAAPLLNHVDVIGFGAISGEDDAFFFPASIPTSRVTKGGRIPVVTGDIVRDYREMAELDSLWPYDPQFRLRAPEEIPEVIRVLWPCRRLLQVRRRFGIPVETIEGFVWYEYRELYSSRLRSPLSIAFAEVATHNHFVLDHGGKVFKQTAPVIKLPDGAADDEYFALLGLLNSSTACFWLKQVCHVKGGSGIGRGVQDEAWEDRYAFNAMRVEQFPLPSDLPLHFGQEFDSLAQQLAGVEPSVVCSNGVPSRDRLDTARAEYERIRGRMIALQEELDWNVYHRYGLLTDAEAAEAAESAGPAPEVKLGERAFEIVLGRRVENDGLHTQWFVRHQSTPITEIPVHWPDKYKAVVAKRIELIERNRNIGLIERPECKRRWVSETWEAKEREALRNWLLDRCEERSLWFGPDGQPRAITVNRLADLLRADADLVAVARLYAGDEDADLADVLKEIIANEHVPFLAQLRYKGEGLLKRAIWERTWDLQRKEDAGEPQDIPVPPKYTSADFQKPSYWRNRGKLDVPKERFISYLNASPDSDGSLLLGWAGWDYREQAHALVTLIEERETTDGWESARIRPLVAGLAEVMPWVRQWHNEVDPNFGQSPADIYDAYFNGKRAKHGPGE